MKHFKFQQIICRECIERGKWRETESSLWEQEMLLAIDWIHLGFTSTKKLQARWNIHTLLDHFSVQSIYKYQIQILQKIQVSDFSFQVGWTTAKIFHESHICMLHLSWQALGYSSYQDLFFPIFTFRMPWKHSISTGDDFMHLMWCVWQIQWSRLTLPHSVDFGTFVGWLLFCVTVSWCRFWFPKVWNQRQSERMKRIEESKHKDFAEFIGRIFMFHASAPVLAVPLRKMACQWCLCLGGWRSFTMFSTWRASKIHDSRDFVDPKFKTSPNALMCALFGMSIFNIE